MTSTRVAEPITQHLDERVLSAGTTQRFVLLLVLCVAESIGTARDFVSRLTTAAGGGAAIPAWVSYVVPVVLIAVAVRLYLTLPTWKARSSRVVPVERVSDRGELWRELENLVDSAGLRVRPRFVVDLGAGTASAVVFGTAGKPTVRLNAGLVVTRTTDLARFRAVVLHELAHIRNGDVGITYATVAMWRVLLCAVLLPDAVLIVVLSLTGTSAIELDALVQKALIVLMVYLTRADILRRRELYADRTAMRSGRVSRHALLPGTQDRQLDQSRWSGAVTAVAEAWRTHPSWRRRDQALTAPDELFAMARLPMVVTGMAAAIASARLTSPFASASTWLGLVQYASISGLVIGVGGVALWRAVAHAVLTERRVPAGWASGLWLGVGLAVGELVVSENDSGWRFPAHSEVLVILIAVVSLLLAWTSQFAELRIRTYYGHSLRDVMVAGLIAPGLGLGFVLLWWHTGAWDTGWQFSVSGALAHADLPTTDAPVLLGLAAVLTALPGSDLGFNGLWWAVPLLWLIPVELWLARLPWVAPGWLLRLREAPNWLVRARRAVSGWFVRGWRALPTAIRWVMGPILVLGMVAALGAVAGMLIGFGGTLVLSVGPAGYVLIAVVMRLVIVKASRIIRAQRAPASPRYWLDQARPGSVPPTMNAPELRWVIRIGLVGGLFSCVGLLAQPLVTRSARSVDSWQVDSLVTLAWIVVVISTAMAVVAVVAAIAANGRYPLITALIAAGVTAVVGVLGQYLRSTVDGCLGPLDSIATTCAWQPIRYLPLVEHALGFVLGPALLVAGLAAALANALSRRHREQEADTAESTAEPRRLARPMVAVGFVNAVAFCLIGSVTAYQTIAMAAPIQRRNLLFAYEVSPTGHIRTDVTALTDWMRYVTDTTRWHEDALVMLAKMGDALADNAKHNDLADHIATIRKTIPPACTILSDIANNAESEARQYDPDPAEEADLLWLRYLAAIRAMAGDCLAIARAETAPAIVAGLEALTVDVAAADAAGHALVDWMSEPY